MAPSSPEKSTILSKLGLLVALFGGLIAWRRIVASAAPSARLMAGNASYTALITGASSGIGSAFAYELAARGYNLVLVARRAERLQALAAQLRQQYARAVEVFVADLTDPDDLARLERYVSGMDTLDLLVNNAGFGTTGRFAEIDLSKQLDMIHVHVLASVRLVRAALPGMIDRRQGYVINVSSIAAYITMPGSVTYCSSKDYLRVFSQALQMELIGTGVQVQALCPGYTYTEFHDAPEYSGFKRSDVPSFLWMPAAEVVSASLDALQKGQVVCIPGIWNRFLVAILRSPRLSNLVVRSRLRSKLRSVSPEKM